MKFFARLTALTMAAVLSVCLLTGCGGQTNSASSSAADAIPETVDVQSVDDICVFLSGLPADEVVATADGIEVTAGELMYWIAGNCDQLLYYSGLQELPWSESPEGGEASFADLLLKDAIDQAVRLRLVEKNAKAAGLTVSQEDLDAIQTSLNSMEAEMTDTGITLDQYLFQMPLTKELFLWICQCEYLYSELAEANFGFESANPPTEESIRATLEEMGLYKVQHILLASVDTTTRAPLDEATVAEKKAQAEKLLADLRSSSDPLSLFVDYMNMYSEDPGLQTNPFGYEFTANTSVDPAFEEAALALEYGQISEIVEGVSGYHIILRLPLDINMSVDADEYINTKISQQTDEWLEQADIQTTAAFDSLSAQTIYGRLTVYREAVYNLTVPADEPVAE